MPAKETESSPGRSLPGARCRSAVIRLASIFVAILLVAGASCAIAAAAQPGTVKSIFPSSSKASESQIDALVDKAKQEGSTVVVISPNGKASTAGDGAPMSMMRTNAMLLEARYNLAQMIRDSRNFPQAIAEVIARASPDGTYRWLGIAVATALGGILFGLGVYKIITYYVRKTIAQRRQEPHPTRARKLRYLLSRAAILFMSSVVMFALTVLVAVIFDTGHDPTRLTILTIVAAYAIYRVLRYVIFFNFFAPDVDQYRMIHLDSVRARRLYRDWYWVIGFSVVIMGLCQWLYDLGLSKELHSVMFIAGSALCALLFAALTVRHRRDLVEIVRGEASRRGRHKAREFVARLLIPAILFYLAAAWTVSTFRLSLGLASGYILVAAPIIVFVAAIFLYGVAIYILEVIYERREVNFRRRRVLERLRRSREARAATFRVSAPASSTPSNGVLRAIDDRDDDLRDEEEMIIHRPRFDIGADSEYRPVFKPFFEGSIGAVILAFAIGEVARLWGVDIARTGHPLAHLLDSALVLAVGLLAVQTINDYVNIKLAEEGGTPMQGAMPADGEGETGVGQTRLATLLPIFRAMLVGVMAIVGVAIVLSNLGLDIGPLFAGAGVVGIAIGFGAQTLIRDVFSGLFFLIDDAFRKGEYIAVGEVQGVIEKISIRSFQLRHHRGALQTVPFGEIKHLTNFSRDWVMMKLPLRVTYGTDVEQVRKLIKKLGQDLLDHPEIGHLFLQPLKSQGVYSMEDSAMIIRVKFMTRPGDQFVTRKVVYAAIREIFAEEGIQFAHREVTVRLADGVAVEDLTPEQREAVAGSVRSVLDDEAREAYPRGRSAMAADR